MTKENAAAYKAIKQIKLKMLFSNLPYEKAKEEAQPHLETLNRTGRKIAREYGVAYKPLTFSLVMR